MSDAAPRKGRGLVVGVIVGVGAAVALVAFYPTGRTTTPGPTVASPKASEPAPPMGTATAGTPEAKTPPKTPLPQPPPAHPVAPGKEGLHPGFAPPPEPPGPVKSAEPLDLHIEFTSSVKPAEQKALYDEYAIKTFELAAPDGTPSTVLLATTVDLPPDRLERLRRDARVRSVKATIVPVQPAN